ncbi:hypothetical protein [Desulfosediminicola flagellatus]|uniref:hypothetical protein n=1 Tax=Desulfosediminicola flagellatus TaxID=2569541 RepID=UPI0010ABBA4B|nr:hypothetical protein [Desulfosediminicola flagellatus]
MSDRLPIVDNLCTNPENHKAHMCELRLAGRDKEIEKYSKDPKYVCGNCGTQSNEQGALCAPGPLDSE